MHAAAWREMFDDYLRERAQRTGEKFVPFDPVEDYDEYVDGRPREDGTRTFLESRGIHLPEGGPDDPPEAETIHALSNARTAGAASRIQEGGVEAYPGSVRLLRRGQGRRSADGGGVVQRQLRAGGGGRGHQGHAGCPDGRRDRRAAAPGRQTGAGHVPCCRPQAGRRTGERRRVRGRPGRCRVRQGGPVRLRRRRGPGRPGGRTAGPRGRRRRRRTSPNCWRTGDQPRRLRRPTVAPV